MTFFIKQPNLHFFAKYNKLMLSPNGTIYIDAFLGATVAGF